MNVENSGSDRDALLKGIISDYTNKESVIWEKKKKDAIIREKIGKARIYFRVGGALVMLCLAAYLTFMFLYDTGTVAARGYWAEGKVGRLGDKGEECLGRMWQIRKASDRYYAVHKVYPDVMEALYGHFLARKNAFCPASGREYLFEDKGDRQVFLCPTPEAHGLKALWCDIKGGPPVVEKSKNK